MFLCNGRKGILSNSTRILCIILHCVALSWLESQQFPAFRTAEADLRASSMPRSHAALEQQIQELTRKNNELQEQVHSNLCAPCLLCSDHCSLRPLCCLAAACSLLWQHQHTGLPAQAQARHTAHGPVQPGVGNEVRRLSATVAGRLAGMPHRPRGILLTPAST